MYPKILIYTVACLFGISTPLQAHDFGGLFERLDPSVVVLHAYTTKP
jgi:hypothetical protein